jgi:hypothetical protein
VFTRRQANSVQKLAELGEEERVRLALAASGDVVYDWTPSDGRIVWSSDPSAHLGVGELAHYESDATFHRLIDHDAVEARLRLALTPPADGGTFRIEYLMNGSGSRIAACA